MEANAHSSVPQHNRQFFCIPSASLRRILPDIIKNNPNVLRIAKEFGLFQNNRNSRIHVRNSNCLPQAQSRRRWMTAMLALFIRSSALIIANKLQPFLRRAVEPQYNQIFLSLLQLKFKATHISDIGSISHRHATRPLLCLFFIGSQIKTSAEIERTIGCNDLGLILYYIKSAVSNKDQ